MGVHIAREKVEQAAEEVSLGNLALFTHRVPEPRAPFASPEQQARWRANMERRVCGAFCSSLVRMLEVESGDIRFELLPTTDSRTVQISAIFREQLWKALRG